MSLTAFSAPGREGWIQERAATWTRDVRMDECDVYELVFTAVLRGVPVRVLDVTESIAQVQLLSDEPGQAKAMGASMIDPGVFELDNVRDDELVDRQLDARIMARN